MTTKQPTSGRTNAQERGFQATARVATEADAAVLADIERRCPIELGDTSVTIDRGDDYFAFARLMEDCTVAVAFIDGEPAGINCGGVHTIRVDGVDRRVMVAVHLRILPEHQRKGLWGTCSQVLNETYRDSGLTDGSCGYVSVDNDAMQRGFLTVPNKWPVCVTRAQVDCAAMGGKSVGRAATPDDAGRIVELLNSTHADEDQYLPYSVRSLTERMERATAQYTWHNLLLTERAVVGVWPEGDWVRRIVESPDSRAVSRRGLVLDYGFEPGAENEFESLLRAWCRRLGARGFDKLSIFTAEGSPGYERIRALASELEVFNVWTPGIDVPANAGARGVYTDQIYF